MDSAFNDLLLTESQCAETFPGLIQEVETAKSLGPFDLPFRNKVVLQAKIQDDEVNHKPPLPNPQ